MLCFPGTTKEGQMAEFKVVKHKRADGTEVRYYYDRRTGKRLDGEPGTKKFAASLSLARATEVEQHTPPGSIGALIKAYKASKHWAGLRPPTQRIYSRSLLHLSGFEDQPIKDLKPKHVMAVRDKLTPGGASQWITSISAMIGWAIETQDDVWGLEHNVASVVKRPKRGSWKRWPDSAVEAFGQADLSEDIRIGFSLLLYTGQRRGDVCKMRWSDYDPDGYDGLGSIQVVQQKTANSDDDILWVPVHPELRKVLDAVRDKATSPYMVVSAAGQPYHHENYAIGEARRGFFARRIREAQKRILGTHYPVHGLRKSASNRLAEAGCTPNEIAAITGHKTLAMVELYTRQADQRRRAGNAMSKASTSGQAAARKILEKTGSTEN